MPTPTYRPLATTTLISSASSITFGSIPASYRDLVIVFSGTATSTSQVSVEFNGDTGSNYFRQYIEARSSVGAGASTNKRWIADVGTSSSNFVFQVMDHSATDKHKTALARCNDSSNIVWSNAGRWANTSAITSIRMFFTASNFAAGSTFSVYGIAS